MPMFLGWRRVCRWLPSLVLPIAGKTWGKMGHGSVRSMGKTCQGLEWSGGPAGSWLGCKCSAKGKGRGRGKRGFRVSFTPLDTQ